MWGGAGPHHPHGAPGPEEPETAWLLPVYSCRRAMSGPFKKAFRKSLPVDNHLQKGTPEASGLPPTGPLQNMAGILTEEKSTFHWMLSALKCAPFVHSHSPNLHKTKVHFQSSVEEASAQFQLLYTKVGCLTFYPERKEYIQDGNVDVSWRLHWWCLVCLSRNNGQLFGISQI